MIDAAIGKGSEIYCVVSPQRGRNGSENFRKPRFVLSYLVTLYAPALLQDEDSTAADEVIESMVAAIHGFEPANLPSSQTKQFLVVPEFFPARLEGHAVWQMRVLLPSQGVTLSFE
ncbi:hypothetical protein HNR46_001583 [Haloferula luteola]|uniref:Uncharacterized protein n=2 Tax=Haloferula luteola TaxID=595692 RepID=A0A840UYZ1_9BACT|nr:hypothetical protein [Haloferula luteola]